VVGLTLLSGLAQPHIGEGRLLEPEDKHIVNVLSLRLWNGSSGGRGPIGEVRSLLACRLGGGLGESHKDNTRVVKQVVKKVRHVI